MEENLAEELAEEINENNEQQAQARTRMVTTTDTVVSVPVSSLIGGFNVINADHFKQMLCVDNGFISTVSTDADIKSGGTHIVIQQQPNTAQVDHLVTNNSNSQDSNGMGNGINNNNLISNENTVQNNNQHQQSQQQQHNNNMNWSDAATLEVFPVRCKATTAELHKSKLGSGGRGRCIRFKDNWFTPSEFEQLCGRGSSKDWKRSIRFGGRSLQALIDEGILTPHATSCTCTACCDDNSTASGPVRLFTPYKRRRKNQEIKQDSTVTTETKKKIQRIEIPIKTEDILIQQGPNSIAKMDSWTSLSDGFDASSEFLDRSSQSPTFDSNQALKRLETAYTNIVKASSDFKRLYQEIKDNCIRRIDQLQRERDAAVLTAARGIQNDDIHNIDEINIQLGGNEITTSKKCANCNRLALAECSLCRRTPYCSTFCQRKDWNAHQVECSRDPNEATQQIMLLVDDQE